MLPRILFFCIISISSYSFCAKDSWQYAQERANILQLIELKNWQFKNARFNFVQAAYDVGAMVKYKKPVKKGTSSYKNSIKISTKLIEQNKASEFLNELSSLIEEGKDTISEYTFINDTTMLMELRDLFTLGVYSAKSLNLIAKALIAYYVPEIQSDESKKKEQQSHSAVDLNAEPHILSAVDELLQEETASECAGVLRVSTGTTLFSPLSFQSGSTSPALLSPDAPSAPTKNYNAGSLFSPDFVVYDF